MYLPEREAKDKCWTLTAVAGRWLIRCNRNERLPYTLSRYIESSLAKRLGSPRQKTSLSGGLMLVLTINTGALYPAGEEVLMLAGGLLIAEGGEYAWFRKV